MIADLEDNPTNSRLILEKIPAELCDLKQWVFWVWGMISKGQNKRTKVPKTVSQRGITAAKSNDPRSWLSFDEIRAGLVQNPETFNGVMMALTAQAPYIFIDLDNAVDHHGQIKAWADEIVTRIDSFTERTVERASTLSAGVKKTRNGFNPVTETENIVAFPIKMER